MFSARCASNQHAKKKNGFSVIINNNRSPFFISELSFFSCPLFETMALRTAPVPFGKEESRGGNHPQKPLRGFPPLVLFFCLAFLFREKKSKKKKVSDCFIKATIGCILFSQKRKSEKPFLLLSKALRLCPQEKQKILSFFCQKKIK